MDDNKKKLGYSPDIQYEEDYYSDGAIKPKKEDDDSDESISFDDTIMDHVQDNIDNLVNTIPILPLEIQTAINQVFKPVFNDWYLNIKGNHYPSRIPDPGRVIIKPKPKDDEDEDKDPEGGGGDPGGDKDPDFDPPGGGDPGEIDPEDHFPWKPTPPKYPDPIPPTIFTPEWDDPVIEPDPSPSENILPIDDDIFAPSAPFVIEYEDIDPVKLVELEYVKNIVDLYLYYTRKLKDVINRFVLNLLMSIITANNETGKNDAEQFLMNNLTLGDTEVKEDLRHLVDMGVRGEVNGKFKLNFFINNFSLESTLYHLKNFKVNKDLRSRYEKEEMFADGSDDGSKSDRALKGLRQSYDKKYETSYINLYKHLNSSTVVLEDVFNTLLLGIQAKEILFKKGGTEE